MNVRRINGSQEKTSKSAALSATMSPTAVHQLEDNRPEGIVQRKLQAIANNSPHTKQQEAYRRLINNSDHVKQLSTNSSMTKPGGSAVLQLKEETDLRPGVFNMIGEIHSDYPDGDAREYDAQMIRAKLGKGTIYYTESMLKVNDTDKDDADPVHLRLEQAVAFIKSKGGGIITKISDISSRIKDVNFDFVVQADKKTKLEVDGAVKDLVPLIAIDTFGKDAVQKKIEESHFSIPVLEALSSSEAWDLKTNDSEGKYDKNFDDIIYFIIDLKYQLLDKQFDDKKSDDGQSDDGQSNDKPVDPMKLLVAEAQGVEADISEIYNEFKGRLSRTLKLYFNMGHHGHYTKGDGHFTFSLTSIGDVLQKWEEFEQLCKKGLQQPSNNNSNDTNPYDLLKSYIASAGVILSQLMSTLDQGMQEGPKNRPIGDVVKLRSRAMHEAAESLKSQGIAWKVGNRHIQDIRAMESDKEITTGYAYITKENFSSTNFNKKDRELYHKMKFHKEAKTYDDEIKTNEDLRNYKGTIEDLGPAYKSTKENEKKIIKWVEEKLAGGANPPSETKKIDDH